MGKNKLLQMRRSYERAEEKKLCRKCNGTGTILVYDNQGKVIGRDPCPACRGRGFK